MGYNASHSLQLRGDYGKIDGIIKVETHDQNRTITPILINMMSANLHNKIWMVAWSVCIHSRFPIVKSLGFCRGWDKPQMKNLIFLETKIPINEYYPFGVD